MNNHYFINKKISRRKFCKLCLAGGIALTISPLIVNLMKHKAWATDPLVREKGLINLKEAMFYDKIDEETVQCRLCPRNCTLNDGAVGFCKARQSHKGKHYSLVYGNPTAIHIDPIEKKPLFHFLPATSAFSIATAGCNLRCKYCQNWEISQFSPKQTLNYNLPPKKIIELTKNYKCPTIAYTYTEPSIFYEYMLDTAKIAHDNGIKNIYHSNGSLNPEPAKQLAKYLDGANIDLKGFSQKFYSEISSGYLNTVLETLQILKSNNVHLEITNLIVPSYNDTPEMIKEMCEWIRDNLGKDVPIHFSRFYPTYKLKNLPPTPVSKLEQAWKIAQDAGLAFVYIGNVPGHRAESTYCPNDGKLLIKRIGYKIIQNNLIDGQCRFCGEKIPGVWDQKPLMDKAANPFKVSKYLG